ncbi:MAG: hypothetical protein E7207_03535 [Clostridium butyricum]|nr:hypothetical protein [Clostridium butyricum]
MKKKEMIFLILGIIIFGIIVGCSFYTKNDEKTNSNIQIIKDLDSLKDMTEEEKEKAEQEEILEQEKYDRENKYSFESSSDSSKSEMLEIQDEIVIKDEGFIADLDKIFANVDAYNGKSITLEGFVRNINDKNFSVLRYYDMFHKDHTHEVTVGINVIYDGEMPKVDDWVVVTGTIGSELYEGTKQPIVKAFKVQKNVKWGKEKVTD